MGAASKLTRQQRAEHAAAYAKVLRIARAELRGRADLADDVAQAVALRLMTSPPPEDVWTRTARRLVEDEAKRLVRAERRQQAKLRDEAAAMTEATHRALPIAGRGRRERLPRGFRHDADGWLREDLSHPANAIPPVRPVTDADRHAAVALAHRALMLLDVRTSAEGLAVGPNAVTVAPAAWLDELQAAFRGALGYDASDEPWVTLARALVRVVGAAHRAPRDEYASMAAVMREWLPPGASEAFPFVTPAWLDGVHHASQLGRGGGRAKGKSVERAVLAAVNAERKRRRLAALPVGVLDAVQTRRQRARE